MLEQPLFDPEGQAPDGSSDLPEWFLPSEPTAADRAVIDRILHLDAQAEQSAEVLQSATQGAKDLARLDSLGSQVFGQEVFARASYARGIRAVHTLVAELLAQDLASHGRERSEAMELAVHEVAAAMGVTRRTAQIRIEEALELIELPRTLAVLQAGYLPTPAARELAHRLAGCAGPLRAAVEARVLDTLGRVATVGVEIALGSADLEELALTAELEPSVAAAVSLGASRPRVRNLVRRALRELTPEFETAELADAEPAAIAAPAPTPRPGDVEFWPTRPGFTFVGSEMTDADAAEVLGRNDSLARRSKRAGDPRSLPELRGAWFRDLLLAEFGGQSAPGDGVGDDGDCPGLRPVPVHLTVHLLDGRTAADSERLGPISPETLSALMTAVEVTGGRIDVRPVRMPDCQGHPSDAHGGVRSPGPYVVPAPLREAIIARDRTCRFPGCTVPARNCDLDHSVPHPRGPTCHCNLACLCRGHHRLKTSGRWTLTNHGNGHLTWTSPTGRTYRISPDPP